MNLTSELRKPRFRECTCNMTEFIMIEAGFQLRSICCQVYEILRSLLFWICIKMAHSYTLTFLKKLFG